MQLCVWEAMLVRNMATESAIATAVATVAPEATCLLVLDLVESVTADCGAGECRTAFRRVWAVLIIFEGTVYSPNAPSDLLYISPVCCQDNSDLIKATLWHSNSVM